MKMSRRSLVILVILVAVAASVTVWRLTPGGAPLNVILISVDTLRPDHLGCYGYPAATSPNIDRLASEGVVFEDAMSSAPLTLPTHTTILTGLYPITHGVRDNGTFGLAPDFTTLAEVLKGAGYSTAAFVGAFVLDSRYGLDQGFDVYDDDLSAGRQLSAFGYSERTADAVTDAAGGWLAGAEEPFLAFIHYYDPHTPYEPPAGFRDRPGMNAYDGEIAFTDQEIGRLLDEVERLGLKERTLVVLISDHGEGLGGHGEATHGYLVYEQTLRVPFIMRFPEGRRPEGAEGGSRIGAPVRLVDVMPTVLEAAGLTADVRMDGRSLMPALEGRTMPPAFCYFETLYPYFAYRWSPLRGVRFNEWKYILAPTRELYNVTRDRDETDNLIAGETERAGELDKALKEFLRREGQAAAAAGAAVSAEEARRLSALGYISRSSTDLPDPEDLSGANPVDMLPYINEYMAPGEEAFNHGDMKAALEKFTRLAKVDPGNPEAHLHRGRALLDMGDYTGAAAAFRRALDIDSTSSTAYFHLGNIAQIEHHPDEALADYEAALRLMPGSPEALANIGSILLGKGLADSAVSVLTSALEVDPANQIALMNLGLAYSRLGRHEDALAAFHRLLRIDPQNAKALANCGAIYVAVGNPDSMVYYFKAAAEATPNDPEMIYNLGSAYRRKQMLKEAGECYQQVIEMEPDNTLALFGLAAVRTGQGRRNEAVVLLKRALAVDPDFELAANALRMLTSGNK
jgi:arylsulfatase A-like enzyme/Tfp pilus assembly protein PilF